MYRGVSPYIRRKIGIVDIRLLGEKYRDNIQINIDK